MLPTFWNSVAFAATSGSDMRSCNSLYVRSAAASLSIMYCSSARQTTCLLLLLRCCCCQPVLLLCLLSELLALLMVSCGLWRCVWRLLTQRLVLNCCSSILLVCACEQRAKKTNNCGLLTLSLRLDDGEE